MMQYDYQAYSPRVESHEHTDYLPTSHVSPGTRPQIAAPPTPRRQIQINSTIDADIVLRRVIEDRAAIIALTTRSSENEAELMKAKTRQLNITNILDQQDEEIARLSSKAKAELIGYHEKSKEYIQSFVSAFDKGDIDQLPRHPFVPSLHELEQAINRRRATLIEKVQSDDRVKRLEFVNTQEKVTTKVMKKNEEAFIRAIDIAKHQLSLTCEVWLDSINRLLPSVSQAQNFDMKKTIERQHATRPPSSFTYPPPPLSHKRKIEQQKQLASPIANGYRTSSNLPLISPVTKKPKLDYSYSASPPPLPDLSDPEDDPASDIPRVIDLSSSNSDTNRADDEMSIARILAASLQNV